MNAPCCYCAETLRFTAVRGWTHPSTGFPYVGTCRCEGTIRHAYSHDDRGRLVCRTWRNDHVATPNRARDV